MGIDNANFELVNIEAEQSVIGGLMLAGITGRTPTVDAVLDRLSEYDFHNESHQHIFHAIKSLVSSGRPIDLVTVGEYFNNAPEQFVYLGQIAKNTPSSANIRHYAQIVKDKSLERRALSKLNQSSEILFSSMPSNQKFEQINHLLSQFESDFAQNNHGGLVHINDVLSRFTTQLEERNKSGNDGYTTGFPGIDVIFGKRKVNPTDLIVLAGRPKMGKSQAAVAWAEHVALELKLPVAIFNMEMEDTQVVERQIAQHARMTTDTFYDRMGDEEWAKVCGSMSKYADSNVYIDDRTNLTLAQIRSECRQLKAKVGQIGLIVIDYLTLMKIMTEIRRDVAVGEITKGLKNLAKELGAPVLLLSQLSREVEKRPDKRPMMSDLRDSGQIEQDCDRAIFVYRDEVYNPESPLKGLVEFIIGANRHGMTGTAYAGFVNGNYVDVPTEEITRKVQASRGQHSKKPRGGAPFA